MELLATERMEELLELATEYALSKNLIPDVYVAGMVDPMLRDADDLDLEEMVRSLIRYHSEWLTKKNR